ncbi:hypothetical protein JCM11251_001910 [Rhodosporidiobolus azoricus]
MPPAPSPAGSQAQLQRAHPYSTSHLNRLNFLRRRPTVPTNLVACEACAAHIPSPQWHRHLNSTRHQQALRYQQYEAAQAQARQGQQGIEVFPTEEVDFGFVEFKAFTTATEHANVVKTLEVKAGEAGCTVTSVNFGIGQRQAGVKKHFSAPQQAITIRPRATARIPIHFTPRNTPGTFTSSVVLTFSVPSSSRNTPPTTFELQRPMRGEVGVSSDRQTFRPREPYVPKAARKRSPRAKGIVSAPKDADAGYKQNIPWVGNLPFFKVPAWLREILENQPVGGQIVELRHRLPRLSYETYGDYWRMLLQAERVQEELDVHSYDLEGARLQGGPNRVFYLNVPGLAEKRPSVLRGDRILVRGSGSTGKLYEGLVVAVELLKGCLDEPFRSSATFDIQFLSSIIPTRRQIHALSQPLPRKELLFPTPAVSYPGRPAMHDIISHYPFFSEPIANNPHQKEAVLSIFYRSHGKAPFVIFGPPGTGKTVTLIETVRQIFHYMPESVLLLTAPSNSAADLLVSRLAPAITPSSMIRLNAPTRAVNSVDAAVKPYCFEQGGTWACPPLAQLKRYRIVVSTCISASILGGVGLQRGHFSHIFVDEAGQATEPQTFLPMSLAGPSTSVILAGDPKQLGPVVRSPVSSTYGLGDSLLDRLMSHPDWLDTNHLKRGVTYAKLIFNYRNHRSILALPNELFYENELVSHAQASVTGALSRWDGWGESGGQFPVLFHAIKGRDEREGKSPSFFNAAEITVVRSYVERLQMRASGVKLADQDIGIIAPYNAQVQKLRTALKKPNMTIGSVEQFQGSERSVIIMSTVRSNTDFLEHDKRFALGFLSTPKRFNVSVTRAQAGLIVVGDPDLLVLDPLWRKFLLYVWDHGGWAGQDWDAEQYREESVDPAKKVKDEMDEFVRRFGAFGMEDGAGGRVENSGGRSDCG